MNKNLESLIQQEIDELYTSQNGNRSNILKMCRRIATISYNQGTSDAMENMVSLEQATEILGLPLATLRYRLKVMEDTAGIVKKLGPGKGFLILNRDRIKEITAKSPGKPMKTEPNYRIVATGEEVIINRVKSKGVRRFILTHQDGRQENINNPYSSFYERIRGAKIKRHVSQTGKKFVPTAYDESYRRLLKAIHRKRRFERPNIGK